MPLCVIFCFFLRPKEQMIKGKGKGKEEKERREKKRRKKNDKG